MSQWPADYRQIAIVARRAIWKLNIPICHQSSVFHMIPWEVTSITRRSGDLLERRSQALTPTESAQARRSESHSSHRARKAKTGSREDITGTGVGTNHETDGFTTVPHHQNKRKGVGSTGSRVPQPRQQQTNKGSIALLMVVMGDFPIWHSAKTPRGAANWLLATALRSNLTVIDIAEQLP